MRKVVSLLILVCFLVTGQIGVCPVYAQDFVLPKPGVMIHLSPEFNPPILKGLKVHPDHPFQFEFVLDKGDSKESNSELKEESSKLIKYFLASLTIPEKDLWVNLSPYEKDRIVPDSFGKTEMGRDLLAEDYMLKQITASLVYPEDEVGKKFWKRVYQEAAQKYGTTNIPVNTFNKVWILPDKAVVYENAKAGTAYVVESKLKVMLEQDYLSLEKHAVDLSSPNVLIGDPVDSRQKHSGMTENVNQLGSKIIREIVIPELTKEVNEGKNFSQLRQVYNSLILATWYKKKIKDSILSQVYADKSKISGVNIDDPQEKERIYQQYLQAFKKGVYNYIKEESDPITQETRPRKYFSGGVTLLAFPAMTTVGSATDAQLAGRLAEVKASFAMTTATLDAKEQLKSQSRSEDLEELIIKDLNSFLSSRGEAIELNGERLVFDRIAHFGNTNYKVANYGIFEAARGVFRPVLYRVGPLYFLDARYKNRLSDKVKRRLADNLILIENMNESYVLGEESHELKYYTFAAILAMLNTNMKGRIVVDSGAGDGLLSIVAKKLGAKKVVLIDIEQGFLNNAKRNLLANDFTEGEDFQILHASIQDIKKITQELPLSPEEYYVFLSNIGDWSDYVVSNQDTLNLIYRYGLKHVQVILSAYQYKASLLDSTDRSESYHPLHSPQRDIRSMIDQGFEIGNDVARSGNSGAIIASKSVEGPAQGNPSAAAMVSNSEIQNSKSNAAMVENKLNELMSAGQYLESLDFYLDHVRLGILPSEAFLRNYFQTVFLALLSKREEVEVSEQEIGTIRARFAELNDPYQAIAEVFYDPQASVSLRKFIVRYLPMFMPNKQVPLKLEELLFRYYFGLGKDGPAVYRNYKFVKFLGSGSEGIVFQIIDTNSKIHYAVKLMPIDQRKRRDRSVDFMERLKKHRRVVQNYDVDVVGGYVYVVKDFVEGNEFDQLDQKDLEKLRNKNYSPHQRLDILIELMGAMDELMNDGIFPGDLQFMETGKGKSIDIKLFDFGYWSFFSSKSEAKKRLREDDYKFEASFEHFYSYMLKIVVEQAESLKADPKYSSDLIEKIDRQLSQPQSGIYDFKSHFLFIRGILNRALGNESEGKTNFEAAWEGFSSFIFVQHYLKSEIGDYLQTIGLVTVGSSAAMTATADRALIALEAVDLERIQGLIPQISREKATEISNSVSRQLEAFTDYADADQWILRDGMNYTDEMTSWKDMTRLESHGEKEHLGMDLAVVRRKITHRIEQVKDGTKVPNFFLGSELLWIFKDNMQFTSVWVMDLGNGQSIIRFDTHIKPILGEENVVGTIESSDNKKSIVFSHLHEGIGIISNQDLTKLKKLLESSKYPEKELGEFIEGILGFKTNENQAEYQSRESHLREKLRSIDYEKLNEWAAKEDSDENRIDIRYINLLDLIPLKLRSRLFEEKESYLGVESVLIKSTNIEDARKLKRMLHRSFPGLKKIWIAGEKGSQQTAEVTISQAEGENSWNIRAPTSNFNQTGISLEQIIPQITDIVHITWIRPERRVEIFYPKDQEIRGVFNQELTRLIQKSCKQETSIEAELVESSPNQVGIRFNINGKFIHFEISFDEKGDIDSFGFSYPFDRLPFKEGGAVQFFMDLLSFTKAKIEAAHQKLPILQILFNQQSVVFFDRLMMVLESQGVDHQFMGKKLSSFYLDLEALPSDQSSKAMTSTSNVDFSQIQESEISQQLGELWKKTYPAGGDVSRALKGKTVYIAQDTTQSKSPVVGFVAFSVNSSNGVIDISYLVVKSGFKRQGIGSHLMDMVLFHAVQNGIRKISVFSFKEAVPFYRDYFNDRPSNIQGGWEGLTYSGEILSAPLKGSSAMTGSLQEGLDEITDKYPYITNTRQGYSFKFFELLDKVLLFKDLPLISRFEKYLNSQFNQSYPFDSSPIPSLDEKLAYGCMHFSYDYSSKVRALVDIKRPLASLLLFAANGAHLRRQFIAADLPDIGAQGILITGFIGHLKDLLDRLDKIDKFSPDYESILAEAHMYAGGLFNGLLMRTDSFTKALVELLAKAVTDHDSSINLIDIIGRCVRILPQEMPNYMGFKGELLGSEEVDHLKGYNSRNHTQITLLNILLGINSSEANGYMAEQEEKVKKIGDKRSITLAESKQAFYYLRQLSQETHASEDYQSTDFRIFLREPLAVSAAMNSDVAVQEKRILEHFTNNLREAIDRNDLETIRNMEEMSFPQIQALKIFKQSSAPTFDEQLVKIVMEYSREHYLDRVKTLVALKRPLACALLFAANGPHTRRDFKDGDMEDLEAQKILINGFIVHLKQQFDLLERNPDDKLIKLEVQKYAGALFNGLLMYVPFYFPGWVSQMAEAVSQVHPQVDLFEIIRKCASIFPSRMPIFLQYKGEIMGDMEMASMEQWNQQHDRNITSQELFFGVILKNTQNQMIEYMTAQQEKLDRDMWFQTPIYSSLENNYTYLLDLDAAYRGSERVVTAGSRAMTSVKPIIYPKNTWQGRNSEDIDFFTSDDFQRIIGINFRDRKRRVLNIGVGAVPYDTIDLYQKLKKLRDDHEVTTTEIPQATPEVYIHLTSYLEALQEGEDLFELMNSNGQTQVRRPEDINDLILVVNHDYIITEMIVGYISQHRQRYRTLSVSPDVDYIVNGGKVATSAEKLEDIFLLAKNYLKEEMGGAEPQGDSLREFVKRKTANTGGIVVQVRPIEDFLKKVGGKVSFISTDNPADSGITDQDLIIANQVTVNMSPQEEQKFIDTVGRSLKEGEVLIINNNRATTKKHMIVVYKRIETRMKEVGKLVIDNRNLFAAGEGILKESSFNRERLHQIWETELVRTLGLAKRRINGDEEDYFHYSADKIFNQPLSMKSRELLTRANALIREVFGIELNVDNVLALYQKGSLANALNGKRGSKAMTSLIRQNDQYVNAWVQFTRGKFDISLNSIEGRSEHYRVDGYISTHDQLPDAKAVGYTIGNTKVYDIHQGMAMILINPDPNEVLAMSFIDFCRNCSEITFNGKKGNDNIIGVAHHFDATQDHYRDFVAYLDRIKTENGIDIHNVVLGHEDTPQQNAAAENLRVALAQRGVSLEVLPNRPIPGNNSRRPGMILATKEGFVRTVFMPRKRSTLAAMERRVSLDGLGQATIAKWFDWEPNKAKQSVLSWSDLDRAQVSNPVVESLIQSLRNRIDKIHQNYSDAFKARFVHFRNKSIGNQILEFDTTIANGETWKACYLGLLMIQDDLIALENSFSEDIGVAMVHATHAELMAAQLNGLIGNVKEDEFPAGILIKENPAEENTVFLKRMKELFNRAFYDAKNLQSNVDGDGTERVVVSSKKTSDASAAQLAVGDIKAASNLSIRNGTTFKGRHRNIDSYLVPYVQIDKDLLEIGAGESGETVFEWFFSLKGDQNLTVLEADDDHVKEVEKEKRRLGLNGKFTIQKAVLGEGNNGVAHESMDFIRMFNVMRHYIFDSDRKKIRSEIWDMLRPQGAYVEGDGPFYLIMTKNEKGFNLEKVIINVDNIIDAGGSQEAIKEFYPELYDQIMEIYNEANRIYNGQFTQPSGPIISLKNIFQAQFIQKKKDFKYTIEENGLIVIDVDNTMPPLKAMKRAGPGGIDLTPANNVLQTQNAGEGIKFHIDPAQLVQLQNAPGLTPLIIDIEPMIDIRLFLGITS